MEYPLYGTALVVLIILVLIIIGAIIFRRARANGQLTETEPRVDVPSDVLPITFSSHLAPEAVLTGLVWLLDLPNKATPSARIGLHLATRLPKALLIGAGNRDEQVFQIGITAEPAESGSTGACFVVGTAAPRTLPELALLHDLRLRIDRALSALDGDVEIAPQLVAPADGAQGAKEADS